MIFSVSSVCLAYACGIAVSAFYVRSLALVGAGFFWLLSCTIATFSGLSIISSDGATQMLSIVATLFSCAHLIYSVAYRTQMKSRPRVFENILLIGVIIFVVAALIAFQGQPLESARLVVGGLLLGGVTSAMLLGHWYLVQPGLTRKPIGYMCIACMFLLCADIVLWLFSPSMISVIRGTISDGWGGTLGYMWLGSCVTTAVLLFIARKALQEKSYSAVMATTGLLYLAILVANGVELIPRAIFS